MVPLTQNFQFGTWVTLETHCTNACQKNNIVDTKKVQHYTHNKKDPVQPSTILHSILYKYSSILLSILQVLYVFIRSCRAIFLLFILGHMDRPTPIELSNYAHWDTTLNPIVTVYTQCCIPILLSYFFGMHFFHQFTNFAQSQS